MRNFHLFSVTRGGGVLIRWALAVTPLWPAATYAQSASTVQIPLNNPDYEASGSEWGCGVLLCLAAVGGAPSECAPYLTRLWRVLTKTPPDPFPTCAMAGAGNYAKKTNEHYELCPQGMTMATGYIAKPTANQQSWVSADARMRTQMVASHMTNDAVLFPGEYQNNSGDYPRTGYGAKACVKGHVNTYSVPRVCNWYGGDNGGTKCVGGFTVNIYQDVQPLNPHFPPRSVDVFIDNQLWNRVFY